MSFSRRILAPASALLLAGLAAGTLQAQVPMAPRAVGLGGAILASARGFESALFNPANLGLHDSPAWSVAFPQISMGSSVLGPRIADLPDFIRYDDLSEARRRELLATIPQAGTALDLDLRAPLFALQVGTVGLAVSHVILGEHTVGRDLVELFFEGYDPNRTDYRIGNTAGRLASYWDLALGHGRRVGPVSVGATAHYYHGTKLVQTRAFEPRYLLLTRDIQVDYVGVASESGRGFGLDVGVALQPMPGVTIGATVANLVSSMTWDENLSGRQVTLSRADFDGGSLMDIETRYNTSRRELGTSPAQPFASVAQGLLEDKGHPTTLRLGASWSPATGTEVNAAFHSDLQATGLSGRWERMAGLGLQQRIPLVTLRVGAATDMAEGSMVGGGARLGPLDLGFARFTTPHDAGPGDRHGWLMSFGVSVRTTATIGNTAGRW